MAKQADYAIGGILFLVAVILFLWVVFRKEGKEAANTEIETAQTTADTGRQQPIYWKVAAFAVLVLIVIVPGVRAIGMNRGSLVASIRKGEVTPRELDDRMPKQLGDYKLSRAWQEMRGSAPVIESGAYRTDTSNEITLGVWLAPSGHSVHNSWLTRGESPQTHITKSFVTAGQRTLSFDTAFYDDGVTDSLTGDIYCTPSICLSPPESADGMRWGVQKTIDFSTRGERAVPIFFVIQTPRTDAPISAIQNKLLDESQSFLRNVDFPGLSEKFQ
jgi:exosortase J